MLITEETNHLEVQLIYEEHIQDYKLELRKKLLIFFITCLTDSLIVSKLDDYKIISSRTKPLQVIC